MKTRNNPSWSSIFAMCILLFGGIFTFFGVIGTFLGQPVSIQYGYGTSEDLTIDSEKPTLNFNSGSSLSINDFIDANGTQEYNETLLDFTLPAHNKAWSSMLIQFSLENDSLPIGNTSLLIGFASGPWNENITTWNSRPSMGKYVQCQPHKIDFDTLSFDISSLMRSVDQAQISENLSFMIKLASPSENGIIIYSHRANNQSPNYFCPIFNIKFINSSSDNREMLIIGIGVDLIALIILIYNFIHRRESQYQIRKINDLKLQKSKETYRQVNIFRDNTINSFNKSKIKPPETLVCPYCNAPLDLKAITLLKSKKFALCRNCGFEIHKM